MARLNLDFYEPSADDVYSDGDIENELLQYAKNGDSDWYKDGRWPVVYHMSHLRQNILNWFPFKENCTILEIGAGCGALTGLLCEHASKVVAVELTKRRAEVNFQRHKQYDNLEIVVCDVQSIPSDWKFDYVVINGVLEYAAYMIKSEQPYRDFLVVSSNHMNVQGRLLLAIENRLGLKYFSGAKEDHTGRFFSGINGYIEGEMVRTFSKGELCAEINKAQLHALKFYYPYPDYKFPAEIFTDTTISKMPPSVPNYPLDMARVKFFEENSVYRSLMDLDLIDNFSNSFLVEIAASPEEVPSDIAYVKLSANRSERFRIFTYFNEDKKFVHKQALHSQGKTHLKNMNSFSCYEYGDKNLKNIGCQERNSIVSFPFLTEKTLEDVLLSACLNKDWDEFNSHINYLRDSLYGGIPLQEQIYSREFEEIFGPKQCEQSLRWTDNANVDMIAGNIFIAGNSYKVIDYEWHMPCKVPQEFVLWRMLKQFVNDHQLENFLTKDMLYLLLNIEEQTENCFSQWEIHFAKNYVGIKDLYNLAKDNIFLDIEQAVSQQMKDRILHSTLFFDLGHGFNDHDYEINIAEYSPIGFAVTFTKEMLKNAKLLRWDPLEGSPCCINVVKIETDGIFTDIKPINAERYLDNKGYEFFTFDPQFHLIGDFSTATYLKVFFLCEILDWKQGYQKREEELFLYRQKIDEQVFLNQQLKAELANLNQLSDSLQVQLNSKLYQLTAVQTELSVNQEKLQHTLSDLSETQNDLNKVQNELSRTQNELTHIQNSLSHIQTQMKENRIKTAIKILLFGSVTRRKSGE
ncbi:methyltransferase [Paenibacillus ehimensis]|uniref:methyltransferase n=1 Tax=Paenibacillus ehimensis TaxID=79264 RepID=UPI000FD9BB21|nr:methyltransferase [Paenibacillus ehimensis]